MPGDQREDLLLVLGVGAAGVLALPPFGVLFPHRFVVHRVAPYGDLLDPSRLALLDTQA